MPSEHTDTQSHPDLQELMRSHRGLVARVLARAGVAERDVPDLVQEVFIVAHRKLPEWQGRAKLSTWLYRVAQRVASDHRRRAYQRRELLPGLDESSLAAAAGALPELERREQLLQLCAALDRLSDEQKQTLVGYELEELSVAELAARTQVPHKTVYSRLAAARRLLRQLLLEQGWALLLLLGWRPRRCWAAWRELSVVHKSTWLVHAPLACCLVLIAPASPPTAAPVAEGAFVQVEARQRALPSATPTLVAIALQPAAAATKRKSPRAIRKRTASEHAPERPKPAAGAELKVIHVGSVERPEELPFGFERIEEPPAPRIALRGPRDAVEGLVSELAW